MKNFIFHVFSVHISYFAPHSECNYMIFVSTYVPLRHNEQVAAARTPELRPAGQKVQSTTVVDCNASRYLPAGQSVQ